MSDHYYLKEDRTYEPCDLMTWANQFQNINRHVAEDFVNHKRISTVWLGMDHNDFGGNPHLFETMIFNENGEDIYCDRYSTWQEAEEGHEKAIQWVLEGCKDDNQ